MTRKCFLLLPAFILALSARAFPQIQTQRFLIDNTMDAGYWIYVVDFDQDGDDDILASALNAGLRWYQNDGAGNFTKIVISSTFTGAWSVHASDIDNDGDLDAVACSDALDQVAWFERRSDVDFKKHTIDASSLDPHSVYTADLDNDGDMDVAAAVWTAKQIVIFTNDGSQNFSKNIIDSNFSSAHSIHAADMDNDGDLDIVASGGNKTAVFVRKNSGNYSRNLVASFGAFGIHPVDVNGDGLLDILRGQRPDGNQDIDWLENNGDGSYTEHNVSVNFGESWSQTAGDLDSDGDIDILAAGFVPNTVNYWLNDGNQGFSEQALDNSLTRPRAVALGDFDQDGDKDIAVITRNTDSIYWYQIAGSPAPVESVTLTVPNGGEILEPGAMFQITWVTTGAVDSVRLEFSSDNGQNWLDIVSAMPDTGSFDWLVPATETSVALVRISNVANAATSDVSDATFSITRPALTLTSPNGGESWNGATTQQITWISAGKIDSVDLEYSLDNGASWNVISGGAANSGSFDWSVPDAQTSEALVRISDAADGAPSDSSDAVFTIIGSSLTVTAPNGGESWNGGSDQTITWNSSGNIAQVMIEYSGDNGLSWNVISASEANTGSYLWTVPDQQVAQAVVRVSDAADGQPSDQSDAPFTIVGSSLTLTAPNGGETWLAGGMHSITWTSTGLVDSVKLEYSTDNGQSWMTISAAAANSGTFAWTIPQIESQSALVRISDAADGVPQDVSDGVFTLATATLTVTAPNGGETWFSGETQTINWVAAGAISSVRLEYSADNGVSWNVIADVSNSGSYTWTVPAVVTSAALVRVSDAADGAPSDISDAVFAISAGSLTVQTPNGGETYYAGTTQTIQWLTQGKIDSVQLLLTYAATESLAVAQRLANTGSYNWQVPNIETDTARLWVFPLVGAASADGSDGAFSIKQGALTVTAPNGGEAWLGDSEESVTWETAGVIDSVNIDYTANGGAPWTRVAGPLPNTGAFTWLLPNILSLRALVRVSSAADASIADSSDATFAIIRSSLTVTAPNGGEQWEAKTEHTITWHSSGIIEAVDLEYSPDNGHTWTTITMRTPNDGLYEWMLPDIESDSVLVRVSNSATGLPADASDARFEITPNVSGISGNTSVVPDDFALRQNYPNPFNMGTRIDFSVPATTNVNLDIFNILGEHVQSLQDGPLSAGVYSVSWDGRSKHGRDLTSGIYLYTIRIGAWQATRRLMLLK